MGFLFLLACTTLTAQVKIGGEVRNLSEFSVLELESTDKGFLIVRMSTAQRDQAFDQSTPAGMMIYNTDVDRLQFFHFETDILTGKRSDHKKWGTTQTQFVSLVPSNSPQGGDLYFDANTNQLFAWNPLQNQWVSIGGGAEERESSSRIIRGIVAPTLDLLQTPTGTLPKGTLYLNTQNGYLYMTLDTDQDGVVNIWRRITGRGADDLGNHTLSQNLQLGSYTLLDSSDSAGTNGQILSKTEQGTLWVDQKPNVTASNGLTLSADALTLGGPLTQPTRLETNAENTLSITGLQSTTYSSTLQLVSVDQNNGVLNQVNVTNLFQEQIIEHIALENQVQFQTPLAIQTASKINVFRNGVLIGFTQIGENLIEVEPAAKCYEGDQIKIIQLQ